MRLLSSITARFVAASVGAAALALTITSFTHGAPKASHSDTFKVAFISPNLMNPTHNG